MGKRQHQSDKLYVTGREWAEFYGGHKKTKHNSDFRRLPFFCCAISLQPVEQAYVSREGHVFEETNIMPWLIKYKTNPITGKKLKLKDLVKIKFHKNNDGKYHCPVLFKIFNENTHIVAVATTGNVFSYDAVQELNIKNKNWKDLLTDEKFARSDLITIQDPQNLEKFNLQKFHHLKHNQKLPDDDLHKRNDPRYYMKSTNAETSQTLRELYKEYKGDEMLRKVGESSKKSKVKVDKYNTSNHSTGAVAASFTSTVQTPQTKTEIEARDSDEVRYSYVKTKGYVSLTTNMGKINIELHCEIAPKTCENFIGLCKKGYYNGTIFHRLIRNFMIQGGDPTGTGTGGESLWTDPFKDEFAWNLSHSERGVLSMANSGPDSNKSQFFITFRSCKHLDRKHTIFGRVVGGIKTLNEFEKVETEKKTDKPKHRIVLEQAEVFVDPFEEADQKLADMRAKDAADAQAEAQIAQRKSEEKAKEEEAKKTYRSGVGKFLKPSTATAAQKRDDAAMPPPPTSSKMKTYHTTSKLKSSSFNSW